MRVIITVAEHDLRGVPFKLYASVLHSLIGDRFRPYAISISPGGHTLAFVEGGAADCDTAEDEIEELARTITDPGVRDGYFG